MEGDRSLIRQIAAILQQAIFHTPITRAGSDAQRRPRKLEARPLAEATEWLERYREYWQASFVRLDGLLGRRKLSRPTRNWSPPFTLRRHARRFSKSWDRASARRWPL
jgi:hypothetical protein